jgi:hypothetical protein
MPALVRPWKPRASSIGTYIRCEWRGLHDRLIDDGTIPAPMRLPSSLRENRDSPNASLGVCEHFILQDGLRCVFAPKDLKYLDFDKIELSTSMEGLSREEKEFAEYCDVMFGGDIDATKVAYERGDPRVHQPLPSEWKEAATLFDNDMELTQEQARKTATLAASKLPKSPDGKPWLSETLLENDFLTGHTDFLSQDYSVVGDLKTTAKPMQHAWIKYEHLAQLAAYHILTGCRQSWVLYVDSMRAAWSSMVWVDWTKPGMKRYAEQVADFCKLLMSQTIFETAMPRLGSHCSETWCPYRKTCYQEMMPPQGTIYNAAAAQRPTGQLTWGGKTVGA